MTEQLRDVEVSALKVTAVGRMALRRFAQMEDELHELRAALEGLILAIDAHHPKFKDGPFAFTRAEIDAARDALVSAKEGQG